MKGYEETLTFGATGGGIAVESIDGLADPDDLRLAPQNGHKGDMIVYRFCYNVDSNGDCADWSWFIGYSPNDCSNCQGGGIALGEIDNYEGFGEELDALFMWVNPRVSKSNKNAAYKYTPAFGMYPNGGFYWHVE